MSITLKSIQDILGMNFFVPNYQRGYRWTTQQVEDLLNDIQEFIDRTTGEHEIYCLQPLVVVKKSENDQDRLNKIKESDNLQTVKDLLKDSWDVIDGQQRLTTIKILLSCLDEEVESYNITYETRENSATFLNKIPEKQKDDFNIDFFHMWQAKDTINSWFDDNYKDKDKNKFKEVLLNKVKFIWYESTECDPISVFTRLNIGKIPLTDAELIKALFLNQSNFSDRKNAESIRFCQLEIAAEWDNIEYTLQNDEFWLFIHSLGWSKPTRIDFIFDLMQKNNDLGLKSEEQKHIGTDEHKTFRYFYEYFKNNKKDIDGKKLRDDIWRKVKKYFQIFNEWYNDLELYHYVGYLLSFPNTSKKTPNITYLLEEWEKQNKDGFKKVLTVMIKKSIEQCNNLTKEYEISGSPKTQCRPLLLLFNIQTVIDQNKRMIEDEKYRIGVFYKFPFHLFKLEQWDIEHIASNTENRLEKFKDQKEYLLNILYENELSKDTVNVYMNEEIKKKISEFFESQKTEDFKAILDKLEKKHDNFEVSWNKNKIWNFALLDSTTNRSYHNDTFPTKRRKIIDKDKGVATTLEWDINQKQLKITENMNVIAFVPPCTKNVFLKYYTPMKSDLMFWSEKDAENYQNEIFKKLEQFGVKMQGEETNEK